MTQVFSAEDHAFMRQAMALAERGIETTHPNPRVGCVVVTNGQVAGRGWHERAGEAHAEVFALRQAREAARGGTLYVTLEPCAHHGRTPPCVEAVIASGVARVVVAMPDPHPAVDGRGLDRLRSAGIAVEVGLMEREARELNLGFVSCITRRRPWVRLKMGMSLDGRTALPSGESQWITGQTSLADVQQWRARSSAILTGCGTAMADNPRLTVRRPDRPVERAPTRVLLDSSLRVPLTARLFDGAAPTLVFHAPLFAPARGGAAGVDYVVVNGSSSGLDLLAILVDLARRGLGEVQVEGGATIAGSLMREGLVDEVLAYIAPSLLGVDSRPVVNMLAPATLPQATRMVLHDVVQLGTDVRLTYRMQGEAL